MILLMMITDIELMAVEIDEIMARKTAESLLATVSGSGDYTNKLVYTDLERLKGFIRQNPGVSPGFSLDDESAVEIRFIVKCGDEETRKKILSDLKLTSDTK
ncbi:hypothetical protein GUITHDRAFT_120819 [Guillardia theta CCMP2712]|uniref:Uncharacterized protein n=1 Tax=Guillardia theta (strain CCMP2712) TaxID=905079 RepID=L1I9T2_GUITC|nr:hypothetical protein GUITHDRAFT_120819 [Guillardia theta CCMP2712]EKX32988.1 hypothetical protein GUITHDRAFT_120819 [Guillardia theta CCMP2712]|eukprot:XP_005819968.1 hypothetical protein GUITHDRAFT_120819 [Guillardia theta CCMP2712]